MADDAMTRWVRSQTYDRVAQWALVLRCQFMWTLFWWCGPFIATDGTGNIALQNIKPPFYLRSMLSTGSTLSFLPILGSAPNAIKRKQGLVKTAIGVDLDGFRTK